MAADPVAADPVPADGPLVDTWLSRRFGLRLPVVSASMAGVTDGAFAAAATRVGILGTFGLGSRQRPDWIREQAAVAARAGGPFGIGLMAWAQDPDSEQLDTVVDIAPNVVSVSFGAFEPYVSPLRERGVTVVTQVGTVEAVRRAVDAGVDAVVARGSEGGGHGVGLVATLPLLQGVLDAVDVPVLAAGGIGTGRGLAAVLAAGAAGAWVGTAFVSTQESAWPDDQVARLWQADETSTAYGHVFDAASGAGWPADVGGRALRNEFFDTWRGREDDLPYDAAAMARFGAAPAARDFATIPVYAGQGVGLLPSGRPSIADVVEELAGAAELLCRAARRLTSSSARPST